LILLLCAGPMNGFAGSKPLELKWTELGAIIQGQRVELALTDGTKVKGEAVVVREDSIVLDRTRKGSAAIAPSSITLLKLERTRGHWGRNLGTTIGLLTGISVGGYVAGTQTNSARAGIPLFLVIGSVVTLAGYRTGRALDTRVTSVVIAPE